MVRAVVDVGSNSLLLAMGRSYNGALDWFHDESAVTGIGEGTKLSGKLSSVGVEKSLAVLRRFWQTAHAAGAESVWAGATMAVRIADDRDIFLDAAKAQGTPVFVLSGDDEAELGFLSVAEDASLEPSSTVAIIDPGGHSTEVVVARQTGERWEKVFHHSFPFGALSLREKFLVDASPSLPQRLAATAYLDDELESSDIPILEATPVVLGATGTNLVSVRDQLATWQPDKVHGATLLYEEVGRAVGWLCDMDDATRAALVGLERGRERTIHGGALILERVLFALKASACRVSVRGWRHALAAHPEFVPKHFLGVRP
ncbi:MAG: hypothetical protein JSS65_11385 [Armatimonadetes bacterium]|nr:hypothetical protein [Armatimonadota bacterium]